MSEQEAPAMRPMYQTFIPTDHGEKEIAVYCCNILDFDQPVDILTTSASRGAYYPSRGSMFGALSQIDINVEQLAQHPQFDLRSACNVWLSERILPTIPEYSRSRDFRAPTLRAGRIGCIEMSHSAAGYYASRVAEEKMLHSIRAYFRLLDIASIYDVPMKTLSLPLLGAGVQRISSNLTIYPLISECLEFLQRNQQIRQIFFIEYNYSNANAIVQALEQICARRNVRPRSPMPERFGYREPAPAPVRTPQQPGSQPYFFISYNCADEAVAGTLCSLLQQRGMQVWYAPNDAHDVYAGEIYNAIQEATHFLVILSENSKRSPHVLTEVNQAFNRIREGIKIKPVCIDQSPPEPSFEYYLAAQHKYFADSTSPAALSAVVEQILQHL